MATTREQIAAAFFQAVDSDPDLTAARAELEDRLAPIICCEHAYMAAQEIRESIEALIMARATILLEAVGNAASIHQAASNAPVKE